MNRITLGIGALAAQSDFGETELIGYYHNEGLYYVLNRLDEAKKADASQMKDLIVEFFTALPNATFGKLSKKEHVKMAKTVLDKMNLSEIPDSFAWKSHPGLSQTANQSVSALLKTVVGFIGSEMTPIKWKAQLEQWQEKLERKTLTAGERVILGGAGSIARHSLTYWLLNNPSPKLPTEEEFKIRIGTGARDIMGGVMGGLIGFGFGGPGGAVVGAVAGGTLASAA